MYLSGPQKGQVGWKARIRLNSSTNEWIMDDGDGAFVRENDAGAERVGSEEAEVVVLDATPNQDLQFVV